MSQLGDAFQDAVDSVKTQLDVDIANIAALQATLDAANVQITTLQAELDALKPQPLPLLSGLSSVNMNTPAVYPELSAYICNVYWSQLQTVPYGPLTANNPIDVAIASGKPFRVRLFFGQHSPVFAGADAGTIRMTDRQGPVTAQIPNWLNGELQNRQADLVAKLAAAYDGKIAAIFMGSNASIYPEPFIRQIGDAATRSALMVAPGYTVAADQASYTKCLDMFSVFKQTRVAWSFNPYQYVNPDGTSGQDTGFTNSMIDTLRSRFPSAIVQNNSIRTPGLQGYDTMYAHMKDSAPLAFQTATTTRVGDLAATIQWAIDQGAHLVEMNAGWGLTHDQLAAFDAALKANA